MSKQFPHILSKLFYEPAIITPARHAAICQMVDARMANAGTTVAVEDDEADETQIEQVSDTAIIPVHGTIVPHRMDLGMSECGCPLEELNPLIAAAEADPNIKRIVFDFRSPGGTVTGVPETGRKILNLSKPTIGFTASECCSGALWLAAQCQRFYATESSVVGSVGVYMMALDLSEQLKQDGVKINAIFAGKYKLLGAYWKPLKDDEREILQSRVDKTYAQFKAVMGSHRQVEDENYGNGLVFDGDEAAERGFTDGVVEELSDILEDFVEA